MPGNKSSGKKGNYSGVASGGTSSSGDGGGSGGAEFMKFKAFAVCCCMLLILIIVGCVEFRQSVMEARAEIDSYNTTINIPLIDQTTNEPINCSCNDPCTFQCKYIKEHFRRIPGECEYTDWYNVISDIVIILLIIGVIGCIAGTNN